MADLLQDTDAALARALHGRNFMLQLRNQLIPDKEIVTGLIVKLIEKAEQVVFPGYKANWLDGVDRPPQWATELQSRISCKFEVPCLSREDAVSPAVAEFWREGSFQTAPPKPGDSPVSHRPALPAIVLAPQALASLPFRAYATTFIGYATDLGRRAGHWAPSVRHAEASIRSGSDMVFVLYQDPAWLFFLGSPDALSKAMRFIAFQMQQKP